MIKRRQWTLAFILLAYLALAAGYNAANPAFEAPDEHWHYFTAQTIAETGQLPRVEEDPDPWMAQEAAQPPLYYVLASAIVRPIDTSKARESVWANPRVMLGDASSPANINAFVHPPGEDWPWEGHVLAVHLVRALSTLIGLGTLAAIYFSGRLVWPDRHELAVLATGLVAFLPQFAFLHASVTNDTLIVLGASLTLWQLLRLWYDKVSWARLLLLGGTIGLAILSKTAGLLLLGYGLFFLTVLAIRNDRQTGRRLQVGRWLAHLVTVGGVALGIGGWLLWRNWRLYGDITAANQILGFFGGDRGYSLIQVLAESSGLWNSLFAVFGWFNLRPPGWIFLIWNGLVAAAVLGTLYTLWRSRTSRSERAEIGKTLAMSSPGAWLERPWFPAALLAVWALLVYAALVRFMMQIHAGQGRLLFPSLLPLALGLAYGLSRFRVRWIPWLALSLALVTSLTGPLAVIPNAYSRPPVVTEAEIAPEASRLQIDLIPGLELIAAQVDTEVVRPGDWIQATLYWRATGDLGQGNVKDAPQYVVELLGREDQLAGKAQSYHGGGLYPATLWEPGEVVMDPVAVRLDPEALLPAQVRLNVKIAGGETAVDVGAVKGVPASWAAEPEEVAAEIDGLQLADIASSRDAARPGETVTVTLIWQVISAPGKDLTTFVHLGDPAEPPLAQGDSMPLGGYYPTGIWEAGEIFGDSYQLEIPEELDGGRYPVYMGLYDAQNGVRQPITVDGQRQSYDAYLVDWLTVTE